MARVDIGVPEPILESLPDDDSTAATDMQRAVAGLESRLNEAIERREEAEAVEVVVDAIEHLEARRERYDEFVPELRAWGQSPIYAIAWRNLQADLVAQLADHDWVEKHIDRERNARLVSDGLRLRDLD